MTLEQTTLFGVRGERARIGRRSGLARIAAGDRVSLHATVGGPVESAGHTVERVWREPNPFGAEVARISGKAGWVKCAALSRETGARIARSGAVELGPGLWAMLGALAALAALHLAALAFHGEAYPDPTCERCGRVLDGSSNECSEEGM